MPQDKEFVFAKHDMVVGDKKIHVNDVGIVESKIGTRYTVFFVRRGESIEVPISEFEFFDVRETGDAFPKKVCNVCCKLLPTSMFQRNQNGVNNRPVRRPSCNDCREVIDGVDVPVREKLM